MNALIFSVGLVLAIMFIGSSAGEEEQVFKQRDFGEKGYGYIYNPSCRERNQVIPGCFRRTGWQKCRYQEIISPGQRTHLPICPSIKKATQASVPIKSSDDGIKREKRGFGKKLRKRLRKFGKQIENVGKKIRINYSSQSGWNAGV